MAEALPSVVLTGASGFVGRSLLLAARERYRFYAIARRSQHEARVPPHPNIEWVQVDIGSAEALERVAASIERHGGADYVVHLAAYYDFDNADHPDYQRTNVEGTRHVLELARRLAVRRFLFASSVAACPVPAPGGAIDEESPPDADFPYARSKKAGELLTREYSQWFPCSIVRLAAVFSDWCEYAPLYVFLSTWTADRWNSRVLGGRGTSAVPYIHSRDVDRLLLRLLERDELPRLGVYLASPDGATSHRRLFELVTRFALGRGASPILVPKPMATVGVLARDLIGRLIGERPFERLWMMEYLDRPLTVDASRTRRELGWTPTPRLHIERRILFLLEKMKSAPLEWTLRNESAMRRSHERPALVVHDAMMEAEEEIVHGITAYLHSPTRQHRFPHYAMMSNDELRWHVGVDYGLLRATVRTNDRSPLLDYMQQLARRRYESGFPASELCDALLVVSEITLEQLLYRPELAEFEAEARDSIALAIALSVDGVQDAYESFADTQSTRAVLEGDNGRTLAEIVEQLNAFYRPAGVSADSGAARPRGLGSD